MFPLYLDENAQDGILVALLRRDEVDCLTSNDAGNGGLSDEDQLKFASSTGRAILTFDKGDFQRLHGVWMSRGRTHRGILVVTSAWLSPQVVHAEVMRLQFATSAEEIANGIRYISSPAS